MKKALGFIFALILLVNLTAVCQAEAAPTDAKPFMDYETALSIFRWIVREAAPLELTEAA